MHTKLHRADHGTVHVLSFSEDVRVAVDSEVNGLPYAALTKTDAIDALEQAKSKAEHFIAEVEGDLEAME